MAGTARGHDVREVAAVLVALAGLRRGEAYASVGAGLLVDGALAAAAGPRSAAAVAAGPGTGGHGAAGPVRVAVAGSAGDLALATARLAPGGRVVAVAADPAAAEQGARASRAVLLRVVALPGGVAWAGRREA